MLAGQLHPSSTRVCASPTHARPRPVLALPPRFLHYISRRAWQLVESARQGARRAVEYGSSELRKRACRQECVRIVVEPERNRLHSCLLNQGLIGGLTLYRLSICEIVEARKCTRYQSSQIFRLPSARVARGTRSRIYRHTARSRVASTIVR